MSGPPPLSGERAALLQRLLAIVARLQQQTHGFEDHPEDQQRWYDRGYAEGMVSALVSMGYESFLGDLARQPEDLLENSPNMMSWTRAYRHGLERGEQETREVLPPRVMP